MGPSTLLRVAAMVTLCVTGAFAFTADTSPAIDQDTGYDARLGPALQRDLQLDITGMQNYLKVEKRTLAEGPKFVRKLGKGYAGSWIEPGKNGNDRFVVAMAGPAPADIRTMALASGTELRQMRYSLDELRSSQAMLDQLYRQLAAPAEALAGVRSWGVDPRTNSVTITAAPQAIDRAIAFAVESGIDTGQIVIQTAQGNILPDATIKGGIRYDRWNGIWCSTAFAVTHGTVKGFVTAGHCGKPDHKVWIGSEQVGKFKRSKFPGTDRAWVSVQDQHRLNPWVDKHPGGLGVKGHTRAPVGAAVCRSGARTGYRCGRMKADNVTVHYSSGDVVRNMTQSDACSGPGDSGGAWITPAGQAQCVHSGGTVVDNGTS